MSTQPFSEDSKRRTYHATKAEVERIGLVWKDLTDSMSLRNLTKEQRMALTSSQNPAIRAWYYMSAMKDAGEIVAANEALEKRRSSIARHLHQRVQRQ